MSGALLDVSRDDDWHIDWRLSDERVVWFASTRPDGRPHVAPVWFWWQDPEILVFSAEGAVKLRNVRGSPGVTLHLDSAAAGTDVVLAEGRAAIADEQQVSHLIDGFAYKYEAVIGSTGFVKWRIEFPQPILVTVTRLMAWSRVEGEFAIRSVP